MPSQNPIFEFGFEQEGPGVYGTYVDEPLALISGSSRYYYHANHLYSVAALTDGSGTPVERYRHEAYEKRTVLDGAGTTVLATSAYGQQKSFTGEYADAETGLLYARGRMYEPPLGRFVSRDVTYYNGYDLYEAYFVPGTVDPFGHFAPPLTPPLPTRPLPPPPLPVVIAAGEDAAEVGAGTVGGLAVAVGAAAVGAGYAVGHYTGLHEWLAEQTEAPEEDSGGGGGTDTGPGECPTKCLCDRDAARASGQANRVKRIAEEGSGGKPPFKDHQAAAEYTAQYGQQAHDDYIRQFAPNFTTANRYSEVKSPCDALKRLHQKLLDNIKDCLKRGQPTPEECIRALMKSFNTWNQKCSKL